MVEFDTVIDLTNKRIIIPKVNAIGDVLLALPLASLIKRVAPSAQILFLARDYTQALVESYADVDQFVSWDQLYQRDESQAVEKMRALNADIIITIMANKPADIICRLAKKAGIPIRIGTWRRFYTWFTCNRFVNVTRKHCQFHEGQYDLMFARPLIGGKCIYSLPEIMALRHFKPLEKTSPCLALLDSQRFNLILHPRKEGKFLHWPAQKFVDLISSLPQQQFNLFITGSNAEGQALEAVFSAHPWVHNLCGKTDLLELMQLIQCVDGLVSSSTGPVHLAAAFGTSTLGLYSAKRPLLARRWGPIGEKVSVLSDDRDIPHAGMVGQCVWNIGVGDVLAVIRGWYSRWQDKSST